MEAGRGLALPGLGRHAVDPDAFGGGSLPVTADTRNEIPLGFSALFR